MTSKEVYDRVDRKNSLHQAILTEKEDHRFKEAWVEGFCERYYFSVFLYYNTAEVWVFPVHVRVSFYSYTVHFISLPLSLPLLWSGYALCSSNLLYVVRICRTVGLRDVY
ncbi:hypothetical protein VTN49DRAFT_2426 [Thermomyces lanuginosus]|uniref:uncharacterized protein n=1 Tax=Thermomyces lanuginosus TaxID=5541 RepID=UPI0037426321